MLRQMYDYNTSFFEVSPDESQLSFPDNDGRVGVLTMRTGEFEVLQKVNLDSVSTVPVWRYPSDLCYVSPPAEGLFSKGAFKQVVLQTRGPDGRWNAPRVISQAWPKSAKTGWLERDTQ